MELTGNLLIGGQAVRGTNGAIDAIDPSTGATLAPSFGGATPADLERACALAWRGIRQLSRNVRWKRAPSSWRRSPTTSWRSATPLIERCVAESGLPRARIEGERGRTVGQLRMFAAVVAQRRLPGSAHRPGAAGAQAPAARRSAAAQHPARPGRGFRRQQFPAGVFGRRRRHRVGAGGRLPGDRQGPLRPSRHLGTGRPRDPAGGRRLRPAGRDVLAAVRQRPRHRPGPGGRPPHQGGRLYRLARRRHGADGASPQRAASRFRCTPK